MSPFPIPTGPWHIDQSGIQGVPVTYNDIWYNGTLYPSLTNTVTTNLTVSGPTWLSGPMASLVTPYENPLGAVSGTATVSSILGSTTYSFPWVGGYSVGADDAASLADTATFALLNTAAPGTGAGKVTIKLSGVVLQELHVKEHQETGSTDPPNEAIGTSDATVGQLTVPQDATGVGHVDISALATPLTFGSNGTAAQIHITVTRTDDPTHPILDDTYGNLSTDGALEDVALPTTATANTFYITAFLDAVGTGVLASPDRAASVNVTVSPPQYFIAVADRPVAAAGYSEYRHYSVELWKSTNPFPAGDLRNPAGYSRPAIVAMCGGASQVMGMEELPDPGWTAWAGVPQLTGGKAWEQVPVEISVVKAGLGMIDAATCIMPIDEGTFQEESQKFLAITNAAEHYPWAEWGGFAGNFSRWPGSLYVAYQTNSNTFIQYVVTRAGLPWTPMEGNHWGAPPPGFQNFKFNAWGRYSFYPNLPPSKGELGLHPEGDPT